MVNTDFDGNVIINVKVANFKKYISVSGIDLDS